MNKITAMVLSCVFASAYVTASHGEECLPEKYTGTKASFVAFKDRCSKKDWPDPETIAYYDPDYKGTDDKGSDVIRYAHWQPLPSVNKIGVVVHFNGRTEFIEKNIYTYKDLLARGFEVWAFDWRGQGFSKREIDEKQKHDIKTFDTYLNDVTYFIDNVAHINKETKGIKKVLLAHSMGAQIALRYLLVKGNEKTFDYAVLSSPLLRLPNDSWALRFGNQFKLMTFQGKSCVGSDMPGIPSYHSPDWSSYFINDSSCKLMSSTKIDDNALDPKTNTKYYSNDLIKDAEIDCLIESSKDANGEDKPDLRLACPTSNWLHAAFESTDIVMKNSTPLQTPTLIVRALPDHAVDNAGQTDFCKPTKNCTIVSVGTVNGVQTGHELLIEQEPIRKVFFKFFDGFVGVKPGL